ncbi:hypothetical protein A5875_001114, partial [Enterococcus sp. 3H8_DIV0648]
IRKVWVKLCVVQDVIIIILE